MNFSIFKNLKEKLTTIGNKEPIHIFSFLILIAIDIFVLVNIFSGIYLQSDQLDRPEEKVPYSCQNFYSDKKDFSSSEKVSVLEAERKNYYYTDSFKYSDSSSFSKKNETIIPECQTLLKEIEFVNTNEEIKNLLEKREENLGKINAFESRNQQYFDQYDTMLLEKIANQDKEKSLTQGTIDTVKSEQEKNKEIIQKLKEENIEIETKILQNPLSVKFFAHVDDKKEYIASTFESLKYWNPLKEFIIRTLFGIPIFFAFLWMYNFSIQKEHPLLVLMFSHLVFIAFIPLAFNTLIFLIDIIPFHFFEDLLDLLNKLNIIAIFFYILIFLGIIGGGGFIYLLQKSIFSPKNIWKKRLSQNQCWSCGIKKYGEEKKFCSFCGEKQYEECLICKKQKLTKSEFCQECGQ